MDQKSIKRRVTKKNTVKKQIKDSKGKKLQDSEEIIKEYQEYSKQITENQRIQQRQLQKSE